jgi:hypothetical protein
VFHVQSYRTATQVRMNACWKQWLAWHDSGRTECMSMTDDERCPQHEQIDEASARPDVASYPLLMVLLCDDCKGGFCDV